VSIVLYIKTIGMKVKNLIAVLCLLTGISCENNDIRDNKLSVLTELKSEDGLSYNQSISKWTSLKETHGNSYLYQTTFMSWSGYGSVTELRVEDGVITSRAYQEFQLGEKGTKVITDSYNESATSLGTHTKGASLLTIDELYDTCAKKYLVVNDSNNTIYFQTSEAGLVSVCGFVPDECTDDCFNGFRISSFDWLK
jgi:hypothetical protein